MELSRASKIIIFGLLALALLVLWPWSRRERVFVIRCPAARHDAHETLVTPRGSGFFSNCSVRLGSIIEFYNANGRLPETVDSSRTLDWYKPQGGQDGPDVTFEYFDHYELHKPSAELPEGGLLFDGSGTQFTLYKDLDVERLRPFVKVYFSPSPQIRHLRESLLRKYFVDPEKTWVLFHRGNDKATEAAVPPRRSYWEHLLRLDIAKTHRSVILQSDETEFVENGRAALEQRDWRVIVFKDEIRHTPSSQHAQVDRTGVDTEKYPPNLFSKYFLAITLIMSECHGVLTATGNCSLWVALFRGHCRGFHQWKDGHWELPPPLPAGE
jgi:hypothetical protein